MKKMITVAALVFLTIAATAGQPFKAVKGSKITVSGTSTMHDWTMESEAARVEANLSINGQQVESIQSLKMTLPVTTLKSGKGGMDDNAYKALKSKDFPQIIFDLKSAAKSGAGVEAKGTLTIAGTARDITVAGKTESMPNGEVKLTGSYTLNMKDYKVDPPSFMFGTVNTGEEVTISYEIILSK